MRSSTLFHSSFIIPPSALLLSCPSCFASALNIYPVTVVFMYSSGKMHSYVVFNNRLVEATKVRLMPIASGLLYGHGVFTTLAIHGARPFLWPQHWMRL